MTSKPNWLKAVKEDNLKGEKNAVAVAYHVKGIPQNFLIVPDGKIIAQNLRGDGLFNKLKDIFGDK